jgi:hypothetical protein
MDQWQSSGPCGAIIERGTAGPGHDDPQQQPPRVPCAIIVRRVIPKKNEERA